MLWEIYFWTIVLFLLVPIPFKLYGYIKGTDDSPTIVKFEEMGMVTFATIGLFGLYGYLNQETYLFPAFWKAWFVLAIVLNILPFFWSAKLAYAKSIMGKKYLSMAVAFSLLLYTPMFFALYDYAYET